MFARPTAGADIPLVPFAGLGSLAAAAEAALPFLLDQLAGIAGPVGNVVKGVGDALALRSGNPRRFDAAALHAWATNPSGALTLALPQPDAERRWLAGEDVLAAALKAPMPPNMQSSVERWSQMLAGLFV